MAVHIDEEALQSSLQRLRQATVESDVTAVMKPTEWDSSDIQALRAYSDLTAEVVGAALAAQEHSEPVPDDIALLMFRRLPSGTR